MADSTMPPWGAPSGGGTSGTEGGYDPGQYSPQQMQQMMSYYSQNFGGGSAAAATPGAAPPAGTAPAMHTDQAVNSTMPYQLQPGDPMLQFANQPGSAFTQAPNVGNPMTGGMPTSMPGAAAPGASAYSGPNPALMRPGQAGGAFPGSPQMQAMMGSIFGGGAGGSYPGFQAPTGSNDRMSYGAPTTMTSYDPATSMPGRGFGSSYPTGTPSGTGAGYGGYGGGAAPMAPAGQRNFAS